MTRITVVDLGMGNLASLVRALEQLSPQVEVRSTPSGLRDCDLLVVPGQGHFGDGARRLAEGFGEEIHAFVAKEKPFLGICVGMQLLFERSEESVGAAGLGIFKGEVQRFHFSEEERNQAGHANRLRVPHMGWNDVTGSNAVPDGSYYFVHSYHCVPSSEKSAGLLLDRCFHGKNFVAAAKKDYVSAVQFHPEKSGQNGRRMLAQFLATS